MISTVILPTVFSLVLSMISQWPIQVFPVPENKKLKNITKEEKQKNMDTLSPPRETKFVLKF